MCGVVQDPAWAWTALVDGSIRKRGIVCHQERSRSVAVKDDMGAGTCTQPTAGQQALTPDKKGSSVRLQGAAAAPGDIAAAVLQVCSTFTAFAERLATSGGVDVSGGPRRTKTLASLFSLAFTCTAGFEQCTQCR